MLVNDYVRLRKPLQIKDIVKGDDLFEVLASDYDSFDDFIELISDN